MKKNRIEKVVENMKAHGLKQVLISDEESLLYLLGRTILPLERVGVLLIKDNGEIHMFVNRILCFAGEDGMNLHEHGDGDDPYADIVAELQPGAVGFDKNWPSIHTIQILKKRSDLIPEIGSGVVDEARAEKDAEEASRLRTSGALDDEAVALGISGIAPGVTEKELSDRIEAFFVSRGSEPNPWYQMVCYGPHAADPHHAPGSAVVQEGDCVLFDLFSRYNGYWCDMTRTVFYKTVSDEHRRIYEIVKRAQQAAIDFVRPGVRMCDVDAAARKVITDAGFGEKFITRTGHGVGMTVHEPPSASSDCMMIAKPGMCFSIEPGIYLEGDIGIRIEDVVMVTEDGCEVLTKYPKDLQIIG